MPISKTSYLWKINWRAVVFQTSWMRGYFWKGILSPALALLALLFLQTGQIVSTCCKPCCQSVKVNVSLIQEWIGPENNGKTTTTMWKANKKINFLKGWLQILAIRAFQCFARLHPEKENFLCLVNRNAVDFKMCKKETKQKCKNFEPGNLIFSPLWFVFDKFDSVYT